MSSMRSQPIIDAAHAASGQIMDELTEALALLQEPVVHNGFGVIVDPGEVRRQVRAAEERLATVLQIIQAAEWPTSAEYEDA